MPAYFSVDQRRAGYPQLHAEFPSLVSYVTKHYGLENSHEYNAGGVDVGIVYARRGTWGEVSN